jgi:hypothetical protein
MKNKGANKAEMMDYVRNATTYYGSNLRSRSSANEAE